VLSGLENPVHILILLLIVLLLFGVKRLPEMGRSLGSGLREFKEGLSQEDRPGGELPSPNGAQPWDTPLPAAAEPSALRTSSEPQLPAPATLPTPTLEKR
jgi:sec-independent protein translocase protein TatA